MRSSLMLTALTASLALASPINQKRAIFTEIVTDYVTVYVTAGYERPSHTHRRVDHSATAIVPVAPTPTTTDAASVPPTTPAAPVSSATSQTSAVISIPTSASPVASSVATTPHSASGTCPDAASATDYISTVLYHHNIHRCNHSAPALTYNTEIAGYAATLAATCNFHHDLSIGGVSYGQNIADYMGSGFDVQALGASSQVAAAITDMWYNGELTSYPESAYGEANPDFSDADAWDHFSQLVWVSSTSVGCATQYCPSGTLAAGWEGWFTVCNYQAAGNMGGEYGANVLPPLGHATVTV